MDRMICSVVRAIYFRSGCVTDGMMMGLPYRTETLPGVNRPPPESPWPNGVPGDRSGDYGGASLECQIANAEMAILFTIFVNAPFGKKGDDLTSSQCPEHRSYRTNILGASCHGYVKSGLAQPIDGWAFIHLSRSEENDWAPCRCCQHHGIVKGGMIGDQQKQVPSPGRGDWDGG